MRLVPITLALIAFGCGSTPAPVAPIPVRESVGTSEPEGPLCEFAGTDWAIPLRSSNGIDYADVTRAEGRGRLERPGSELVFAAEMVAGGWRLSTLDHPANHALFHLVQATRFGELLTALAGTEVVVGDAQPGALEVELPAAALNRASLRLLTRAPAHVPCDGVTLAHPQPSGPPQPGEYVFLAEVVIPVAAGPGLEPLVEIVPSGNAPTVRRVERRDGWSRIVRRSGGIELEGWIDSAHVLPNRDIAMSGLLGALRGSSSIDVCTSNEDLDVRVRRAADGAEADVGVIMAGTRFVRVNGRADDMQVQPYPNSGVMLRGGVTASTSARAPLECHVENPGGGILGVLRGGGLGGVLGGLPRRVPQQPAGSFRVRVTRVRGLSGVRRGSTCTIDLTHGSNCRAEIQCGQHTLFGETSRLGFFPCEYRANPLRVVGEDSTPTDSTGAGDAAMRLDTDAGTLTMHDSSQGHIGEYELEGQIVQSTPP